MSSEAQSQTRPSPKLAPLKQDKNSSWASRLPPRPRGSEEMAEVAALHCLLDRLALALPWKPELASQAGRTLIVQLVECRGRSVLLQAFQCLPILVWEAAQQTAMTAWLEPRTVCSAVRSVHFQFPL